MQAEHITIVDNRQKYRARLFQAMLSNPKNQELIKRVLIAKLRG